MGRFETEYRQLKDESQRNELSRFHALKERLIGAASQDIVRHGKLKSVIFVETTEHRVRGLFGVRTKFKTSIRYDTLVLIELVELPVPANMIPRRILYGALYLSQDGRLFEHMSSILPGSRFFPREEYDEIVYRAESDMDLAGVNDLIEYTIHQIGR